MQGPARFDIDRFILDVILWRTVNDLTQENVAFSAGIRTTTYQSIENRRTKMPTVDSVVCLAHIAHLSLKDYVVV